MLTIRLRVLSTKGIQMGLIAHFAFIATRVHLSQFRCVCQSINNVTGSLKGEFVTDHRDYFVVLEHIVMRLQVVESNGRKKIQNLQGILNFFDLSLNC